jgi:prevent-host-death family protein
MKVIRMSLSEVKNSLSGVVHEVQTRGDVVIITRHGHDAARLTPIGSVKVEHQSLGKPPHRVAVSDKRKARPNIPHVRASSQASPHRATTWTDLNSLAEQIRKHWPEGITAEDVMNDVRGK